MKPLPIRPTPRRLRSVHRVPYARMDAVAADRQIEVPLAPVAEGQDGGAIGRCNSDAAAVQMDLVRRDRCGEDGKKIAAMDLHICRAKPRID